MVAWMERQRNPGAELDNKPIPRISLALHPGYYSRKNRSFNRTLLFADKA
ncbi:MULTISPECIES: hypothetical protein [unclassified Legionella]|nr:MULTISPECIES: hypothetical protein [unclassified Legionella]MDI9819740.1 hypothetical protein [Legionella sp. PL877]